MVSHLKEKNIEIIYCCYHVQISLKMSQQTKSDIFHTKMLQNALWCQIMGTYKVRNETKSTKTKRNEINENETKSVKWKRNETKTNESKTK